MTTLSATDFPVFFEQIWGYPPFPWQARLVTQVATTGRFPEVLDLPTGSGKTALIDMAVFLMAIDPRTPRRIVMVVDRRVVVDQTARRAERLGEVLRDADQGVLAEVSRRLSALGGGTPLRVVTLRGGIPRDDTWVLDPAAPTVISSTVDQVGSRLLFRGYGVSARARAIHAGLLGNDTLFLLDEVHLSEPFRQTLSAIGRHFRPQDGPLPDRWHVVEMSATPAVVEGTRYQLDDADRAHPVLGARLHASKPTRLVLVADESNERGRRKAFTDAVVQSALELIDPAHRTIGVILNRVDSAVRVHQALVKAGHEAVLLTGRSRPLDRVAVLQRVEARAGSGHVRDPSQPPLFVVATQTIEAGADLDFDGMVTACASLDALKQRFGRLDRLGQLAAAGTPAQGVILARADRLEQPDPIYDEALSSTWRWLIALDSVDMGRLPSAPAQLYSPRPDAPVLLAAHLDLWAQTSPGPQVDPDVSLWLHGAQRSSADVQVVWRADLDPDLLENDPEGACRVVAACPPGSAEVLAVPIWAARAWLRRERRQPPVSDVQGQRQPDWHRVKDTEPRPVLVWRGDDSEVVSDPEQLRPGQTLVVPASYGGIAHGNWDPGADGTISDLGTQVQAEQRGRAVLRLHPDLLPDGLHPPVPGEVDEEDEHTDVELLHAWLDRACLRDDLPYAPSWRALAAEHDRVLTAIEAGGRAWWVVTRRRPRAGLGRGDFETAEDASTHATGPVLLADHVEHVRERAVDIATRLGLPQSVVAQLDLAARGHDLGKADPRFQQMLAEGDAIDAALRQAEGQLLAKSGVPWWDHARRERARLASGYPTGTRHELLSVALLQQLSEVDDTVLHLVASHHGWCRPFPPARADDVDLPVRVTFANQPLRASTAHGLQRLDRGIPERFWAQTREWGWWGLAWLEAILRLSDQWASQTESRQGGAR